MNPPFSLFFLFLCNSLFAQISSVHEVDSLLNLAQHKLEHKKFAQAKAFSQQLLGIDSIIKPNTTDVKMAHFYKHAYDSYIRNEANFICGESLVYLKEYDSALVYLKKVSLPFNYGALRAFSLGIVTKTKLALLVSTCYEKLGFKEMALDELLPLIFIDVELNYFEKEYSHKQVIKKINKLSHEKIKLDTALLTLDTSRFESNTIFGYSLITPPVYYHFKELKIYILPRTELVTGYYNCVERIENIGHPFLSDTDIIFKLHRQQMINLLHQFAYFKE